jgi:hypothetical protein
MDPLIFIFNGPNFGFFDCFYSFLVSTSLIFVPVFISFIQLIVLGLAVLELNSASLGYLFVISVFFFKYRYSKL